MALTLLALPPSHQLHSYIISASTLRRYYIAKPISQLTVYVCVHFFFFSSRRRHTRLQGDWSSDVCSSDLRVGLRLAEGSWGANGDNSMWLNDRTAWTWRRLWALEDAFWDLAPKALASAPEIGRASCRERV